MESTVSAVGGYFFLYTIAKLFAWLTGKNGIGQGDLDLLAFIGSFTGLLGLWASVLIGSLLGTTFGIIYLLAARVERSTPIPFGPFLATGAISFVLFQATFLSIF